MKNRAAYTLLFWVCAMFTSIAQDLSSLQVKYMVTYSEINRSYTAWVIPNYQTPNHNNPDSEEKGVTAQFALKVPKGFVMSDIRDLKGAWDKVPVKIGNEEVFTKAGADPSFEYYIIGKTPSETNYGTFARNEPVALFSFKGNDSKAKVGILEANDPFIKIADESFSLNVGSSFYSRSGQQPLMTARPNEQFDRSTELKNLLNTVAQQNSVGADDTPNNWKIVAYPNPADKQVNLKFFSKSEGEKVSFRMVNMKGSELKSFDMTTKLGMNTLSVDVSMVETGSYLIHGEVDMSPIIKKVTIQH